VTARCLCASRGRAGNRTDCRCLATGGPPLRCGTQTPTRNLRRCGEFAAPGRLTACPPAAAGSGDSAGVAPKGGSARSSPTESSEGIERRYSIRPSRRPVRRRPRRSESDCPRLTLHTRHWRDPLSISSVRAPAPQRIIPASPYGAMRSSSSSTVNSRASASLPVARLISSYCSGVSLNRTESRCLAIASLLRYAVLGGHPT